MGNVHVHLDDELEEEMRKQKVRKRGDLSEYVEGLIREDLKK